MPEPFDEPGVVVTMDELTDDSFSLLQVPKPMEIKALLLEGADEPLSHSVTLGLPHIGWGNADPQPLRLIDPGLGDILRPPVTAKLKSPRSLLSKAPKGIPNALPDRLQRGPTISNFACVPAHHLINPTVHSPKRPTPTVLFRIESRGIGAPHHIRSVRDDGPIVGWIAVGRPKLPRGQKSMKPHQPKHPLAARGIYRC